MKQPKNDLGNAPLGGSSLSIAPESEFFRQADSADRHEPARSRHQGGFQLGATEHARSKIDRLLEDFNFNFNPQLNRQQVLALAACDYLREARNVLICGPAGVGKTHLAQALGQEACRQGYDVLFVATHKMLQHLAAGRADNSLERRLAVYLRPDLLILDDFGLRALPPPGPEDLYDVISERYEKGSILLTSNRAPQEWPGLFGDPLLAAAGLDRLGDRAEMLVIRGQSYRTVAGRPRAGSHAQAAPALDAHPEGNVANAAAAKGDAPLDDPLPALSSFPLHASPSDDRSPDSDVGTLN